MILSLHTLQPAMGAKRRKKNIGRGNASGHGTYSTRGIKGQKARTGGRRGLSLLAMKSLVQSMPKRRGFVSLKPKDEIVHVEALEKHFEAGMEITPKALFAKHLISSAGTKVKLLGKGQLRKAFVVMLPKVSSGAKKAIEDAGGRIESR